MVGNSQVELHVDSTEGMGRVQTVFLGGTSKITGDNRPHQTRRGNAPREHGAKCGDRNAGSPAAGAIPNKYSQDYFRTKQTCGKLVTKHPATVGGTTAADADDNAVHAAVICC